MSYSCIFGKIQHIGCMAYEFTAYRKVEFSDTDMAGLVHFSNYFRYMEIAERDFFQSLGVSLIQSIPNELVG